jgi:hypothetical protein
MWPRLKGAFRALTPGNKEGASCQVVWSVSGMGKPGIRKYANGPNTQKYPRILSPAGAKRR